MDEVFVAAGVGVARWFETELSKLRTDVFRGETFVVRPAAAPLHCVACEKAKLRANVSFANEPRRGPSDLCVNG